MPRQLTASKRTPLLTLARVDVTVQTAMGEELAVDVKESNK